MGPTTHARTTGRPLGDAALKDFAARLRGDAIAPHDAGYDEARRVWNGMIDRRPALIAYCEEVADVVACVELAREHDLLVAVRGGGHNVAGTGVCDDGLVIDLSRMREVETDPATRTVRVQAGATWADVDRSTQPHGLAVPGGVISTTGVAGLTLSGGLSSQRRRDGMSVDNLLAAVVVTGDGEIVRASETEHPDLLWALKGGGGNFGVVTAFEFRAHPLGPEVAIAQVAYPIERSREVMAAWRDALVDAPDELTSDLFLWELPPAPELPAELHHKPVVLVFALWSGDPAEGERELARLRDLGGVEPVVDLSGRLPFVDLQSVNDGLFPNGRRYYWKALYVDALPDDLIDLLAQRADARPTTSSMIIIRLMGGAIGRVAADATAFGERGAPFNVSVDATWESPADDDAHLAWTRTLWDDLHRWSSTGQAYLNFPGLLEEGDALLRSSYGANLDRLVDVKTAHDPANRFRVNQNIRPRG